MLIENKHRVVFTCLPRPSLFRKKQNSKICIAFQALSGQFRPLQRLYKNQKISRDAASHYHKIHHILDFPTYLWSKYLQFFALFSVNFFASRNGFKTGIQQFRGFKFTWMRVYWIQKKIQILKYSATSIIQLEKFMFTRSFYREFNILKICSPVNVEKIMKIKWRKTIFHITLLKRCFASFTQQVCNNCQR